MSHVVKPGPDAFPEELHQTLGELMAVISVFSKGEKERKDGNPSKLILQGQHYGDSKVR